LIPQNSDVVVDALNFHCCSVLPCSSDGQQLSLSTHLSLLPRIPSAVKLGRGEEVSCTTNLVSDGLNCERPSS
jgi:hypothetical protein